MACVKNKYQNTSRESRRTPLQRLYNRVMRSEIDPDVFLSEIPQQRDELNDFTKKVVTNEHLITIILVVLPKKGYPTVNKQSIRDRT